MTKVGGFEPRATAHSCGLKPPSEQIKRGGLNVCLKRASVLVSMGTGFGNRQVMQLTTANPMLDWQPSLFRRERKGRALRDAACHFTGVSRIVLISAIADISTRPTVEPVIIVAAL